VSKNTPESILIVLLRPRTKLSGQSVWIARPSHTSHALLEFFVLKLKSVCRRRP